jgi:hypothetical protein
MVAAVNTFQREPLINYQLLFQPGNRSFKLMYPVDCVQKHVFGNLKFALSVSLCLPERRYHSH